MFSPYIDVKNELSPRYSYGLAVGEFMASIVEIMKQPDVQAKIIELDAVSVPETSAEFGEFIVTETLKWA